MTRGFLRAYAATLVPLLAGLGVVVGGWEALAGLAHPWVHAAGVVGAWMVAVAIGLRRRGWPAPAVHAVTWGAPAVVLAVPAVAGWLSADGLVLWAPAVTVAAVALGMVARPADPA